MKNFKLIRGVQLVLISLFILVVGFILCEIFLGNDSMAATKACPICNNDMSITYKNETYHYWFCTSCSNTTYAEEHTGGTHANGGVCAVCELQYQTHETALAEGQCTNLGIGTHQEYYACTVDGCTYGYTGQVSSCYGGNHYNDGVCTGCGVQYQTHQTVLAEGQCTNRGTGIHQDYYVCTLDGCAFEVSGDLSSCYGGTHANGGVCTGCGVQYQTHEQQTYGWYSKTSTTHTLKYSCTCSTCDYIYTRSAAQHTGGTHDNGGICEVCQYPYQEHSQSSEIVSCTPADTGHIAVYSCTFTDCEGTYNGEEQSHTGGTHDNGGICEVCNHPYQEHSQSDTINRYYITDTTHTPIYACSFSGCNGEYEGSTVEHTGGTHDNGGTCEVCNDPYQEHSQASEIVNYTLTDTGHIPVYSCTFADCEGTHNGEEESHASGTHDNGGICAFCNNIYQNHTQSSQIVNYTPTDAGHIAVYSCAHEGCTSTFSGTEENHVISQWSDNENGTHSGNCVLCKDTVTGEHTHVNGQCSVCSANESSESCSHTYVTDYDSTYHWKECSICGQVQTGSLENHEYTTYTNNGDGSHSSTCTTCQHTLTENHSYENGQCSNCNATASSESCSHTYATKYNSTYHWEECSICGGIKSETTEVHNFETYTNNGDGTHSSTCTICQHSLTENHSYENGQCSDCNATKPNESCSHTYVINNDSTHHWEECSICGAITSESTEAHNFETYVDNGNGTHSSECTICHHTLTENHDYENGQCSDCNSVTSGNSGNNSGTGDNTIAGSTIPQTGSAIGIIILISIITLGTVSSISIFKMKKYKNI